MPNMPEKDPGLWAAVIAWLVMHQPQLYAAGLSVGIAVLRVMYGAGTRRQMYLEGARLPLLEWMGRPQSMATFAGSAVGFLGFEKVRGYYDRAAARKVEG